MDTTDLNTLIALVEQGGVTRAADVLHRVPSAITSRLQQLERRLGVTLFLREGRRLILTAEGHRLYEDALRIMALIAQAESQVRSGSPGGRFRLGAMESMAATRLPAPLAELYRRYPRIELELTTGISRFLLDALAENRLDAAFIADAPVDQRFDRLKVFEEQLVIIAPAAHGRIDCPADIRCPSVLVFRDGCSYRSRLLNWFHDHHCEPGRVAVMSSYHAILGGVAAGMGAGIVPATLIDLFPARDVISVHPVAALSGVVTELMWRTGRISANIESLKTTLGI